MKRAILIIARLKSTRLPYKVIKEIKGRPMISHMLDRLRLSQKADRIILCTSTVAQDDPLVDIAKREGIDIYRGDPDDVLARLRDAASEFGIDTVINCTADNPFVDPVYIDRLIEFHEAHGNDYSKTEGLPFGTFSYALSYEALKRVCCIKDEKDTEVWGGYFTETGLFRWGTMAVEDVSVLEPDLRLTVDTPKDFELISRIFDRLYCPGKVFSLAEIVDLCRRDRGLYLLNQDVRQKPAQPIKLKKDL